MSNCLQLDHVDYAYGAAKIRVLSDVSADFESGKMYAITGPSGAGKSTLLSLLAGVLVPRAGTVSLAGRSWSLMSGAARDASAPTMSAICSSSSTCCPG